MILSGQSPDGRLVEIVELRDHPWFVASQFHPEFNSRPTRPEPLFREFVGAAARRAAERGAGGEPEAVGQSAKAAGSEPDAGGAGAGDEIQVRRFS